MTNTVNNLPAWSLHAKSGREGLYAFVVKPWDEKQTSVKITDSADHSEANRLAPGKILEYLDKNAPKLQLVTATHDLRNYVDEFFKDELSALANSTKRMYEMDISKYLRYLELEHGSTEAEAVTWPIVRDYFTKLRNVERANKGIDNVLVNLRIFQRYVSSKVGVPNYFMDVDKLGRYSSRDVIWFHNEFDTYYKEAIAKDKPAISAFWHTGMYPADFFYMQKKHIKAFEDDYVINKLREKSTSASAIINFPLKWCPCRDVFIDAYNKAVNAEDYLFIPEIPRTEEAYNNWYHSLNQRRTRLWKALFPGSESKWFQDMRHTFATEAANGARFGVMVPEWQLEQWLGWVPGSAMGRKFYISRKAMPDLMKPQSQQGIASPFIPLNLHERLPFT